MRMNWLAKKSMLLVLVISVLLLSAAVQAETPREQLNQMVQQLQQQPNNTALREKIIKLAQQLKPALSVPEEARRAFIEGTTFAKTATDPSQQKLAVDSFREALKIAPWWGDAYYNLAVAQELVGQLEDAQASLKLYLLTNPSEKDVRDAQDKIYALDAKKKLAARVQAEQAAAKAAEEAKYGWVLGRWRIHYTWNNDRFVWDGSVQGSRQENDVVFIPFGARSGTYPNGQAFTDSETATDPLFRARFTESGNIEWQHNWGQGRGCPSQEGWHDVNPVISGDRRTISFRETDIYAGKCTPTGKMHEWTITRE